MVSSRDWKTRIPEGVRDIVFEEANQLRRLEGLLAGYFEKAGYREVIPPTFGFLESMGAGAGVRVQEDLYKFIDRRGRILALRPDMTTPVARLAATHLASGENGEPLRIWYSGQVFRYEESRRGRPHEFRQTGVELIGAAGPEADAEVLSLAIAVLEAAGLPEFSIALGHVDLLEGIWDGAAVNEDTREILRADLGLRDHVAYEKHVFSLGLNPDLTGILISVIGGSADGINGGSSGGFPPEWEALRSSERFSRAAGALADLAAVLDRLHGLGQAGRICLDLTLLRNFNYYTGTVFEAFAPGLGTRILGGGRYDNLLGEFGRPRPATGFALEPENLLIALERCQ